MFFLCTASLVYDSGPYFDPLLPAIVTVPCLPEYSLNRLLSALTICDFCDYASVLPCIYLLAVTDLCLHHVHYC